MPVVICMNTPDDNAYDPGALYLARELGIEHFYLLHDTCRVLNKEHLFRILNEPGCHPESPGGLMFIGKYELSQIPPLPPKPRTKEEAVNMESTFRSKIPWASGGDPTFVDGPEREVIHGRERMIIRGRNIYKVKSHWNMDQVRVTDQWNKSSSR